MSLFVRGLWWRRGLTVAVLAVATVTTGSAALGPLYARAAGESTLRDELSQAPPGDTGLHLQAAPQGIGLSDDVADFPKVAAQAPAAGSIRGYPNRTEGMYITSSGAAPSVSALKTGLLWRQDACAHLVIVAGRCPTKAGEVLVSARTVQTAAYGWRVGGDLDLSAAGPVKIVGSYRPISTEDPFWYGHDYFDAALGSGESADVVDTVMVTQAQFQAMPPTTLVEIDIDYLLDSGQIRLDNVPGLRRDVAALAAKYGNGFGLTLTTNLDRVLNSAAHQRHLVNIGTLLVTLQLSLLAWLVLFQVVADAVESRGNEIALAKLRGQRPWWTVRFGLGESMLLLVLAIPAGLLLAWLAAHLFAATVLVEHTPVVLTWSSGAAMLAAFAGGVVAAGLAAYRTLTRPVLAQWRRTTSRPRHSWPEVALDVVLAAAAVAGLLLLRVGHRSGSGNDSAALLAPGLLVIAVALLGTRLLPVVVRGLLPVTRSSTRIGLFLAARQVVRRPAGLRLAALLAVAVGLATFAVGGEAVAVANRGARAKAEVGAAQVASIQFQSGQDPVTQVRRADPDGKWAMTAATWLPDGGNSVVGPVLAVDSARFGAVGYPAAGGPSPATIGQELGASTVPVITVTAKQLRVQLTASGITGGSPQVQFVLRTPQQPFMSVAAGSLTAGTHDYTANVACPQGCTFLGLTWYRLFGQNDPMKGTVIVRGLAQSNGDTWEPIDAGLATAGAWRGGPNLGQSHDAVSLDPQGTRDDYTSSSGGYGGISYGYSPSPLPAIATPRSITPGRTALAVVDGFGSTASFRIAQWAPVLPVVLDDGVLMDLNFLRAQLPDFDDEASWQVWLGPDAPADAPARLRSAGLLVEGVKTEHSRVIVLGRQGPALSLFLLLACAIVGAILAVGGTAISISASGRRRSFESAALRAVGVRSRFLYRAGLYEQLMLLGTAVVLGVPAGVFAARLAMPVIPEFADTTPVALHYRPPALPVLAFTGGFVVLVVLAAAVAAHAVLRSARPGRLREAEE